jgi:hypothetical protein
MHPDREVPDAQIRAGALEVPIDTFVMQLQPSEIRAVAAALPVASRLDTSRPGTLEAVADAVRALPPSDRAPLWELAVRHYARHRPAAQAAGEIGMDPLHARELLDAFTQALRPPPGTA